MFILRYHIHMIANVPTTVSDVASHLRQLIQGSPQDLLSRGTTARIRSGQGPSDFTRVRQQGQVPVFSGGHSGTWR